MPTPGSDVIFKFGTKAEYEALDPPDPNTLYFLSDTQELYLGDKSYGGGSGEVNWHEIVEGTNIHLFTSITEPEDTLALWIAYDNQDNLRFKVVTDNLPYLDDQGHKNDITDKYNSPTDMNPVDGSQLDNTLGAASFVIAGETYLIGGIRNVNDPDRPDRAEFECFHGIRKYNGSGLETVAESITGLTRQAVVNAEFVCSAYDDEDEFSQRLSIYQIFEYDNHMYVAETLDDDVNLLIYELTFTNNEFITTIKFYNENIDPVGKDLMTELDFNRIFLIGDNLVKLVRVNDIVPDGILVGKLSLIDFTFSVELLVSGQAISDAGIAPILSTVVGYYEGKYYWLVVDENTYSTTLFKLDSADNTITSIATFSDIYYSQPAMLQVDNILYLYGNVAVNISDFSVRYNKIISLNVETDEVALIDNNITDAGLCHGTSMMYQNKQYIAVGSKIVFDPTDNNIYLYTLNIPAYSLGSIPDSILLCIGNRENKFTIYNEEGSEITYPIDYVLVPNSDKSAYVEADAYLYKNNEWVKLGGNA